jgi:anti-sigma factor RsiW
MKCERAMELIATGNILGRLRARRHAARCSNCAAEAARLRRIADVLAAIEPLTPSQRALWSSASIEPRPSAARSFTRGQVRLALAAAVLVAGIGLSFVAFWPAPVNHTGQPTAPAVLITRKSGPLASPAITKELESIASDLKNLSRELAQLSRQAALLDERRDAEALGRRLLAMNQP